MEIFGGRFVDLVYSGDDRRVCRTPMLVGCSFPVSVECVFL